jgi:hypothetical protein
MAVTQVTGAPWTRKHDLPGSPLLPAVKIYYPTSLADLIEICRHRPVGEHLKAGGSHWALSTAAVSDTAFIETNDPHNAFAAMNRTLYNVIPGCLDPNLLQVLMQRQPAPFDKTQLNENEGAYFVHIETGKRVYELYAELDLGDTDKDSLATQLAKQGNSNYLGPWAFPTLGGAGGQTIFGALNTGTHGGDHRQPPIADAVVAIHLVADDGDHYWIEPALLREFERPLTVEAEVRAVYDGVAGASHFHYIRDTDTFNAVLVSAGRFGVVYSIVIQAVRQYCLHEQRRLVDWQDIKSQVNDLQSDLYTQPQADQAFPPKAGATRFLQIAVSLTPHHFFSRNLAGVTKRWNVPAFPDEAHPAGRAERTGANAGNSVSYTADPDKPGQAQPMSLLERACASGDFLEGLLEAVALEIKELIEDNAVAAGGVVAAVAAVGGTAGLLAIAAALAALLAALLAFVAALRAKGNSRFGQTIDDLRALLLDQPDPASQAAGVFIWQCIYYKLFSSQQDDMDYQAISYAVMDQHNYLDQSCDVNVDSIEVFFDATDPTLVAFIDALIAFEAAQEFDGRSFSGYASLRFTGSTQALIGMQRWPVSCAIEIAGLKDVRGTTELIDYALRFALNNRKGGAILHWGQRNTSNTQNIEDRFGASAPVRPGELQIWRNALAAITHAGDLNGFSSAFTRQTGLEP